MTEAENVTLAAAGEGVPDIVIQYTYVPMAVYTFVVFVVFACTASPLCSWYFCPKYRTISTYNKFDWNSRLLSFFHAILVSFLGIYNLLFDKPTRADPIWGDSYLPRMTVAITTGYILCDLGIMLVGFPLKESVYFILHHLAVALAYLANLLYGPLTFFANARVIAELSTPFVNFRWMLFLLGYRDSTVYFYNGWVMLATFFLVRVAMIPYFYYYLIGSFVTGGFQRLPLWMTAVCWCASLALDTINVYWFLKMARGAYRMLQKRAANADKVQTRIKEE